ncbi:CAP domain-containing protein [Rhodococcus sp. IEGM 1351]|uniref:CAP domain-containing protein n=1 Tax=Rhodococcus sp. IEGM 1351 TaxID=3047089 RepID=UPI0024B7AF3B|nr:CAP domain-containing protein [Rhodococcus sp. IEGM 1351]MDI9934715.1 CAP domain-containing protein [Rhodococcus sp. IEGM 1351]
MTARISRRMRDNLICIAFGLIAAAAAAFATIGITNMLFDEPALTPSAAVSTDPVDQNALESLVNEQRADAGKKALATNTKLRKSACAKADDILAQNYWAHTSPSGVTPWSFIEKAGYEYSHAGENLAKAYPDDAALVQAWMDSQTHRKNVLGEFTEQGICQKTGTLDGKSTTVTVMHVGETA